MNVLLTSVGRRTYLIRYFKEALKGEGKVFVCNSSETVSFKYADGHVISPLIYDKGYIPFLLDFCKEKKIDVLISLFDIDLPVLSQNKKEFEKIGVKVIVSDEKIIKICNDKWLTYNFLKDNGFFTPKSFLKTEDALTAINVGEINYPVIVKPRFGCGSISIGVAYDKEDLNYLVKKTNKAVEKTYLHYESDSTEDKVIIQEKIEGQEYGADIINDLNGKTHGIVLRKKLAMRSGETDIAEIVQNPVIEEQLLKLGQLTGHIGNMDCDVFFADNKPFILEMNARFGGGYPFSHLAGCDLPSAIIKWAKGESVNDKTLKAKVGVKGFKDMTITEI